MEIGTRIAKEKNVRRVEDTCDYEENIYMLSTMPLTKREKNRKKKCFF